jgi:hypothetical protein
VRRLALLAVVVAACSAAAWVALLLAGCRGRTPSSTIALFEKYRGDQELQIPTTSERAPSLTDVLPGQEALPGWKPAGPAQRFDSQNLYDLVDGQAEAFFAYAFEQVAVGSYENASGASLRIEVWQVAEPTDAYGLYSTFRSGTPVAIGNEGDGDPGRLLHFWQDRYHVRIYALQALPEADLQAAANAVAQALPGGGSRPALVDRLPDRGLVARSDIFFHQEISIQSNLWLGGENLLGLSAETDGVLARYQVDEKTAQLLLMQYPNVAAASAGLEALRAGQVSDLAAAQQDQDTLYAVFGPLDQDAAQSLIAAARAARASE